MPVQLLLDPAADGNEYLVVGDGRGIMLERIHKGPHHHRRIMNGIIRQADDPHIIGPAAQRLETEPAIAPPGPDHRELYPLRPDLDPAIYPRPPLGNLIQDIPHHPRTKTHPDSRV